MRRPHFAYLFELEELTTSRMAGANIVDTIARTEIGNCKVLATPEKTSTVFDAYDVTLARPWLVFFNLADAAMFVEGNGIKVRYNGADRDLIIRNVPSLWAAGVTFTYGICVCEEAYITLVVST